MNYLDLTLPSVAENLALDEALLLEAEASRSGEILRFWQWPTPTVVLGAGSRLTEDVHQLACQADGVDIFRRSSGGGTVLLGQGCLCYSLILSYDHHAALREIHSSFRFILGRVRDALAPLVPSQGSGVKDQGSGIRSQESGVESQPSNSLLPPGSWLLTPDSCLELAGTSDLSFAGRKISGNSQQRKRRFLLHHGTILYAFDANLVDRYLHLPSRQPDYRLQRKHGEFLTNLPAPASELQSRLLTAWKATAPVDSWPREMVRQLAEDKYARPEWIRRR
jgi:lipoate-protein ligase A